MTPVLPKSVEEMKDIIDIEGIVVSSSPDFIRGVLFALALVFGIFLLFFILRKIIRKIKGEKALTPDEKALLALKNLKKQDLIAKGDYHGFYFCLDEIFRRYLYDRFSLDVLDKTYEQIKMKMDSLRKLFSAAELPYFVKFLDRAQLVKFAKMSVEKEFAEHDFKFVNDFVLRTKLVEKPIDSRSGKPFDSRSGQGHKE